MAWTPIIPVGGPNRICFQIGLVKYMCVCSVAQSYLTLCDPMDCSPQAPLSMGFSRQEYWTGLPSPPAGDLPHPEIKPTSPVSPALAGGFFTTEPAGKPGLSTKRHYSFTLYVLPRCWVPGEKDEIFCFPLTFNFLSHIMFFKGPL